MAPKKTSKKADETLARFSFFNEMKTGNKYADTKKKIDTTYIDTTCYALNALYSGDMTVGFPSNRIIMLAGEQAVGKTYFTIWAHALRLQQEGRYIFYFDSENAVSEEMLMDYGLDPNSFRIVRVSTVEECKEVMSQILDQVEAEMGRSLNNDMKCAFILDSLGQLTTLKSVDDASSGKHVADMTKQKELKRLFAITTNRTGMLDIPFIITNHVYQVIGAYVPTSEVSGGSGAKYAASAIIMLRKRKFKDDKTKERLGSIIVAKAVKSRWTREDTEVTFYLDFKTGLNRWYGVHQLADQAGLLEKYSAEHKAAGIEAPKGARANSKVWVCKHPDKPMSEWVACWEKDLHREDTIGTIFEPVNEWVKANFKLSRSIDLENDGGNNASLDIPDDEIEAESELV